MSAMVSCLCCNPAWPQSCRSWPPQRPRDTAPPVGHLLAGNGVPAERLLKSLALECKCMKVQCRLQGEVLPLLLSRNHWHFGCSLSPALPDGEG
uniref:Putative secreted protein n=1 Tax=Ixodes ricinus TaxID=34613 RepID=A0A6B0U2X0_IXORI